MFTLRVSESGGKRLVCAAHVGESSARGRLSSRGRGRANFAAADRGSCALFDRNGLREVAWLVHVAATAHGDVVRE